MKIHLHSRQGLYEVENYGRETITCSTKHSLFQVPTSDFKSFAGGNWNFNISKEKMDTFLSVVQPEKYKLQFEQENEILSLATRIDMIDKAVKASSSQPVVVEEEEDNDYPEDILATKEDYEKWWRQESDKNYELNNKMRKIAHEVYSQNLDFSNFTNRKGIKFIIQQDWDEESYRLCWDPYGFVSNYHSDISSIFQTDTYGTINGGWIKIFENDVVLYYKSGDYGVYDDAIAMKCALKLFPGKNIHSFAGRQWDNELELQFDDLPF
jgi:hypothetical protein